MESGLLISGLPFLVRNASQTIDSSLDYVGEPSRGGFIMFNTTYFLIGKVSIASSWVALILSFLFAYSVVRWKYGKPAADLLSDAIFYFIIVWKLSVVLTDFKTVIQMPLSIIYFHGGMVGVILGIIAAAINVFWALKKGRLNGQQSMGLLLGTVFILSIYQVLMVFFNEGPFVISVVTVALFGIFSLVVLLMSDRFEEMPVQLIVLLMMLHVFISALQPAGLFQTPMFAAVLMGSFLALLFYYHRKNHLEEMH